VECGNSELVEGTAEGYVSEALNDASKSSVRIPVFQLETCKYMRSITAEVVQ
jgi:hypothetical protein